MAFLLLAYLAVMENVHSREALATLLWPNYDARRGRTFLRRELTAINRALGEGWLAADRETVGLERPVNPSTSAGGQDLNLLIVVTNVFFELNGNSLPAK